MGTEENKEISEKHDDVVNQLQVIVEERDGLREGMDLLWQEKAKAVEDLENVSEGYTHLSDRLCEKIEESRELEEQLQQYEQILSMLQENAATVRNHSPNLAPKKKKQEDEESNYEDDFEKPDAEG